MSTRRLSRNSSEHTGRRVIVGPILTDLLALDWRGEEAILATAFYSKRALESLAVSSKKLQVFCRLDKEDPFEWARGMVAPDALLAWLKTLETSGKNIELRVHRSAHAKVYCGQSAIMIGSANLTLQGFGGGWEIVHTSADPDDIQHGRLALNAYASAMDKMELDELDQYVKQHRSFVRKFAKKHRTARRRDRISTPVTRPARLGNYQGFLTWLGKRSEASAQEILDRAYGKAQLSGHINRNFFGLRQFLLAYPDQLRRFQNEKPDEYKLSKDAKTEGDISAFVRNHASDEDKFTLDTWMTYLPKECGGRAAKHGGTIGNLNRMLPLVARYLAEMTR